MKIRRLGLALGSLKDFLRPKPCKYQKKKKILTKMSKVVKETRRCGLYPRALDNLDNLALMALHVEKSPTLTLL